MAQTRYIRYVPKPKMMKRIATWHVRLYRATFGLVGRRVDGLDILLLTTVGKKSRRSRTVPLPYFRDRDDYVLIASYGGNHKNPAWYFNLQATPRVTFQVGRKRMEADAIIAEEPERTRIWDQVTAEFPRYLNYQKKTARQIPVIVLRPCRD